MLNNIVAESIGVLFFIIELIGIYLLMSFAYELRAKKRARPEMTFVATARGFSPVGLGFIEVFYNLYEDQSGHRIVEKFEGAEVTDASGKVDMSITAAVNIWLNSTINFPKKYMVDLLEEKETEKNNNEI